MPSEKKARIERFALFVVWEMCKDALLKLTVNFQNLLYHRVAILLLPNFEQISLNADSS